MSSTSVARNQPIKVGGDNTKLHEKTAADDGGVAPPTLEEPVKPTPLPPKDVEASTSKSGISTGDRFKVGTEGELDAGALLATSLEQPDSTELQSNSGPVTIHARSTEAMS